jgi:hypothetical protein
MYLYWYIEKLKFKRPRFDGDIVFEDVLKRVQGECGSDYDMDDGIDDNESKLLDMDGDLREIG